ncbi:MAG: DUF1189 family protein [Clostridia bacterium]
MSKQQNYKRPTFNIGFIQRLKYAISDKFFAKIIIEEKFSKSLWFYLKLTLILTMILGIVTFFQLNDVTKDIAAALETQVPDFHFEQGSLHVDGKMPIEIVENDIRFVIDTTDQTTINQLKPTTTNKQISLITSDGIYFYDPKGETSPLGENISFDMLSDISITKEEIVDNLKNSNMVPILLTFITLFGFIFHKLISPVYLFLFARIISIVKKIPLKGSILLAIVLYSLTVPHIIHLLISIVGIVPPYFDLISVAIGSVFVIRYLDNFKPGVKIDFEQ